ncbi:hypothetical protein ND991_21840 [Gordonia sputi]|uniref:hypothetical protein n=1 Tax=Gordonia sputi TaxID=36823 RepID=UPI0020433286|nr:hypothetical protein [Gordonia sputi]MCM3897847.1 hypothetical protein [Gordonia sputi]
MTAFADDVGALDSFITEKLGPLPSRPLGWPDEIEAALLDAVFSIQARYGNETSGVRAVVKRWRTRLGAPEAADDLDVLAATTPEDLAKTVQNASQTSGRLKAAIVIDAAKALSNAGLKHASDFDGSSEQKRAYLSVKGCGPVTWSYFGMLLGKPDVKADTWIVRFVSKALDRQVSPPEAHDLVVQAAAERGVDATQLDHAIWRYARTSV